jgi:hypothetical protein
LAPPTPSPLLERVPPHWLRPALLYDLHMALEKLTDELAKPLKVARGHVGKLVKEPVRAQTEMH